MTKTVYLSFRSFAEVKEWLRSVVKEQEIHFVHFL